jgi:mannose-6-phosphate isomerase-like protein (cupin superfamily)
MPTQTGLAATRLNEFLAYYLMVCINWLNHRPEGEEFAQATTILENSTKEESWNSPISMRRCASPKKRTRGLCRSFGSETFRSWILYFRPGEHTDMHYHMSPETFLVLQGKASVKGLKGEERIIEKNEIVFLNPKDYYQLTNVGTEPLVLVENRSEAFGGPHVTAEEDR